MGLSDTLAARFDVESHGSDVRTELVAGLTTFLAMSYIIVVNPAILSDAIQIEGYGQGEVFQMIAIATILSAAIGTVVMALYANRPFGLAPGLGLNAFFAYTVVLGLGIPWQTALAAVFVEGVAFMLLTLVGARKYVIQLFPEPVKRSVGAGIGLFLLFIGFQELQIVVPDDATLVTLGGIFGNPWAILGLLGLAFTFGLWARGITGSIVIGILTTAAVGWGLTLAGVFERGVITPETLPSAQYDITPLAGAFVDGLGQIEPLTFVLVVFTFFFVDFFDTAGTLIGVSQFGDFLDEDGDLPDMDKPLMADAVGTTAGAMLGTSTVTTFIESSTGVEEGGRTGLTALAVAGLFVASLAVIPIVAAIPSYASFIALIVVGVMMLQGLVEVDWDDPAWAVSAGLTVTVMPFAYSIADGLAAGIIAYPLIKVAVGEYDDVAPGQYVIAALLVVYYVLQTRGVIL
ncbi:NCS2 family permease [Halorubrum lacusprofundi]|jgi:AGZA family xanthine/uracil permease-like MFS transporter|uniref:Xanthine/uracil/vitamin C permease n=1 Tax=Halorubrum lacusprofundi (strain ATCC 49239 / DSM 5036 / JCM 8891 / ACAM 34) TaxID=416348 RepID=B9LRN7_HALLT|nr:NCS2 family permease [Halorubrum lacusprofundi]ACM55860.1 Xanthine/uracil/vitamin C permease [Halorubrum lacusprofundi ATCC 49239]MCG1006729.1 NCS2 family permease [Halorubrum lacusprofundi]